MSTAAWVDWLEERYSHWAIPGLHRIILAVAAVTWLLGLGHPAFLGKLELVGALVNAGEWWRLLSFVLILPPNNILWTLLLLVFTCSFGDLLESEWGSFKQNLFFLISYLGLVAVAFIEPMHEITVIPLYILIIVAIGTLMPNYPISPLFIPISIPAKIFAWVFGAMLIFDAIFGDHLQIIAASLGYLAFFAPSFISEWKTRADAKRRMKKFRGDDDEKH